MVDEPRPEDWEVLGLEPGASREEIERAYQRRRSLYAPDTLASYSLYDEHDRTALLASIDEAYRRVGGTHREVRTTEPEAAAAPPAGPPPAGPPPDLHEKPGAFLQYRRATNGVSIHELAEETKIRASLLEMVENEDFSTLPAEVYVRGFVVQCAKTLGVTDPEQVAYAYLKKMRQSASSDD